MPRQLKGTLEDFHTTQLLHLINLAKKTGTLHIFESVKTGREIVTGDGMTKRPEVVPGKERAKVAFKEGKLIHAVTTTQDGHLASVLHKSGKLNDEQHRIIREKAASASDKALALLLINANYVTQGDIVQSVQQHTLDIVYDLMALNKEPFIFEEGELPSGDRITVPVDLENVIIEGTRRTRELDQLSRELPNLDFALRFPEAPSEKFKGIQLSVEEWRVVSFINPKNSIRQIAKACNMSDMEIRRIVYGLMNAGLVELVRAQNTDPNKKPLNRPKPGTTPPQRPVINKLIDRIKNL
ncbi:MAG: DUF4388 domain-containing protein [Chloroflexota bacterium]